MGNEDWQLPALYSAPQVQYLEQRDSGTVEETQEEQDDEGGGGGPQVLKPFLLSVHLSLCEGTRRGRSSQDLGWLNIYLRVGES